MLFSFMTVGQDAAVYIPSSTFTCDCKLSHSIPETVLLGNRKRRERTFCSGRFSLTLITSQPRDEAWIDGCFLLYKE
jgi:hypothetical protein